jgi:hypothetical protein
MERPAILNRSMPFVAAVATDLPPTQVVHEVYRWRLSMGHLAVFLGHRQVIGFCAPLPHVDFPKAVDTLKAQERLAADCELRQVKYLNNLIEQAHRFLKRRTRPGLGFFAFDTAQRALSGFETMHMLRKGKAKGAVRGDILAQVRLIESVFGLAT